MTATSPSREGGSPQHRRPRLQVELDLPDGTFEVAPGAIVTLPDDARHVAALTGELRSGRHRIVLDGTSLQRRSPAARVRAGLVSVGAGIVAPDVSVVDHLVAVVGRHEAQRRVRSSPLLAERGDDPAGVLSGGERRVLDWLVADALAPTAVVLDRPATGLDPDSLGWAHGVLDRWLDDGVGVVLRPGRSEEVAWTTHRADGSMRHDPATSAEDGG